MNSHNRGLRLGFCAAERLSWINWGEIRAESLRMGANRRALQEALPMRWEVQQEFASL